MGRSFLSDVWAMQTYWSEYCLCIKVVFFQKADVKGAIISRLTAQMSWVCEDNKGAQFQVPKVSWYCIVLEGFFVRSRFVCNPLLHSQVCKQMQEVLRHSSFVLHKRTHFYDGFYLVLHFVLSFFFILFVIVMSDSFLCYGLFHLC